MKAFFACLVVAFSALPSFAAWGLPNYGYPWTLDGNYTILETGVEVQTASGAGVYWEWFVVDRPNGLCDNCKTVAILLESSDDSRMRPLSDRLNEAFRAGKKIRFIRNSTRNSEPNVSWMNQNVDIYRIKPGDQVDLFLK